jgi:tetratricopeptide (TPR) repeat protein
MMSFVLPGLRPFLVAAFIAIAVQCGTAFALPASAYLVARQADRSNDFQAAANGYLQAMRGDASNPVLIDGALGALIGAGRIDRAVPVARLMSRASTKSRNVDIVLLAEHLRTGLYDEAIALLRSRTIVGGAPDALFEGWAHFGAGRTADAFATFEKVARIEGVGALGRFSGALALAASGDYAAADAALATFETEYGASRRSILARVQVLSTLGQNAAARAVLDDAYGPATDIEIDDLRSRLDAGETIAFDIARDASEGAAEVFLALAAAVEGERDGRQTLAFARFAQFMRPDHIDATLFAAETLSALEQWDLAIAAFESISEESPARFAARLGRAEVLSLSGRTDAALEEFASLARVHPESVTLHVAKGDLLRRESRFGEAADAYGRAIALLSPPEPRHWALFYSRAIANERAKKWEAAEPDFRKALELSPDQPQVLNYLGYSFLEMGTNLDEAMAMIENAVAQRPEDGHIVDSLAWGMFLLGRYDEAVVPMERAALLMPLDPIVTDHLGDVYWAVGRKREAEFQWRRALSFDPEPEEVDRIRRKLEVGLDTVLAEEGAPPLLRQED